MLFCDQIWRSQHATEKHGDRIPLMRSCFYSHSSQEVMNTWRITLTPNYFRVTWFLPIFFHRFSMNAPSGGATSVTARNKGAEWANIHSSPVVQRWFLALTAQKSWLMPLFVSRRAIKKYCPFLSVRSEETKKNACSEKKKDSAPFFASWQQQRNNSLK